MFHLIPWRGTEKAREVQTESTPPKEQQIKAAGAACRELRGFKFELGALSPSGQRAIGLVIAVGIANFLAEWLGLVLRPQIGAAIILCRVPASPSARRLCSDRVPACQIATSVAIATAASSIMFGKGPWVALAFGLVNADQALLTTWLIERWFGERYWGLSGPILYGSARIAFRQHVTDAVENGLEKGCEP